MGKKILDQKIINDIQNLRKTGHSIPEIRKITGKGSSTVFKYIKNTDILPEYVHLLKEKQGGSKFRSQENWRISKMKAESLVPNITNDQKFIILACLYWAEGRKMDFDIVNSDPDLLRTFINCLEKIGVPRSRVRITLRLYEDIDPKEAKKYWMEYLNISDKQIIGFNILKGKKVGKLKYGMCRLRIIKGDEFFKLIISIIGRIKELV